jgi:signal peptidase I
MTSPQWQQDLQALTERYLTWRQRRRLIKKEKQRRKNPVLDWVEVIVSAALIVLVINQYLFQAYMIPSESMVGSLEIGDRIFVNKLVFGPELIPGMLKMPGYREPRRGEVVIFENPTYNSKGPAFDVAQRLLYMLTLTLVDIDRDDSGNVAVHFLIKRAIGMPGDRMRVVRGNMEFLPPGETAWVAENDFRERVGLKYPTRRLFPADSYAPLERVTRSVAQTDAGLKADVDAQKAAQQLDGARYRDAFYADQVRGRTLYEINPHLTRYGGEWRKRELGWFIGPRHLFPMGDNRDNSRDARYFNAVTFNKVLGRATVRFWPLARVGAVR